jgi:hypothetical protein
MLQSLNHAGRSPVGVLGILIDETTNYRRPSLLQQPDDYTLTQWMQEFQHLNFQDHRFPPIRKFSRTWLQETTVQFHYFHGGWMHGNRHPSVSFPLHGIDG